MADRVSRECRVCGLERECRKGRRVCVLCERIQQKHWIARTRRHVPGRRRNWRQHAEIKGVIDGKTSWVTCSKCKVMKLYRPRLDGKGGIGWRGLQCADCTAAAAREWRAAQKQQAPRSGPCSKCGVQGEYENGIQCKACFRAHAAAYMRQLRADGREAPKALPAHSRICGKCRNRCRVAGVWKGDTCPPCWKKAESIRAKKKRQDLKRRMVSAGEWECSECHQVKPVDEEATGWAGQKCPPCQRLRQRARYAQKRKSSL